MSVYMTEDEQLENIKKWWKKHGNLVTVVVSIVLLTIAAYRYYTWHEERLVQQASATYENMMVALSNDDIKSVRAYANQLTHDFSATVYSDVAHLSMAKVYVDKEKIADAKKELEAVANHARMPSLKQIAKIRMARLFATDKQYDAALKQLSSVDDSTYLPVINELKGDIYGATGQYQQAIDSYHLAITEVKDKGMGNLFLEMKSNEMALKSQSQTSPNQNVQNA